MRRNMVSISLVIYMRQCSVPLVIRGVPVPLSVGHIPQQGFTLFNYLVIARVNIIVVV